MALMDNASFLISHIRNSFITSDDTGMCELIIDVQDVANNKSNVTEKTEKRPLTWHPNYGSSKDDSDMTDSGLESDTELSHSYDILPDMDFAAHRRRSNTAQRLEKLKREKHKQSKIKHVQWKDVEHHINEIGEYFEKEDIISKPRLERKSLLTVQLENFAASPNNPFIEYAKFDGKTTAGLPTKRIAIFLTMCGDKERVYPMNVVTLGTAKVQDLIGLICWQYTSENRLPSLRDCIEAYSLHIAEDDGEVDADFPALDHREPISKFGFAKLALVERDLPSLNSQSSSLVVTINIPNRGFSKIPLDDDSVLMRDLMDKLVIRRKLNYRGLEYRLEKQAEPGVTVDLDSPLSAMDTLEFCLVRENSVREDLNEFAPSCMSTLAESLSSHQYKSYVVSMHHKLTTTNKVHLGISGEKIEIDPVQPKGKILSFKQKAVTYDTEYVAACALTDEKPSGKATFRLTYQNINHDLKHHDFDCDIRVAREVVQKVNNILEIRSSPVRKEYLSHRERKRSISFKRRTLPF